MANSTNSTGIQLNYRALLASYYTISSVFIIAGSAVNLWFLIAILTSPLHRSRLRNKFICCMFIVHLIDTLIYIPYVMGTIINAVHFGKRTECAVRITFTNLQLVQETVANLFFLAILLIFLAQILDFDPRDYLREKASKIAEIIALIAPWVVTVIVIASVVSVYNIGRYNYNFGNGTNATTSNNSASSNSSRRGRRWKRCNLPDFVAWTSLKYLDGIVLCVAILVFVICISMRYWRYAMGRWTAPGAATTELMSKGRPIDSTVPYAVAIGVSIICELPMIVFFLGIYRRQTIMVQIIIAVLATIAVDLRAILMPLPWLILPDFRERIKTWRPWYRPAAGIDLTVTYNKYDE